ncbi:MAG: TonB-dependent receptor, partial [Blastomonas sp.]|nr:TonB-dependent receptor [Blastomonas sp.]
VSARVQTQVYFSRTFDGLVRDPRNDFGGYTLTDAYLGYQVGPGRIILSAQNIFNRQYIDYNSDVRLPTDNLSFFAGRGRTMTLAWDMRF